MPAHAAAVEGDDRVDVVGYGVLVDDLRDDLLAPAHLRIVTQLGVAVKINTQLQIII